MDAEERWAGAARLNRHERSAGLRVSPSPKNISDTFDCRSLHERRQRYPDAESALDLGEHPKRQQRVPSEGEEVVPNPYAFDSHHLFPDLHELEFQVVTRRSGTLLLGRWLWHGEGSSVQLPAGGQR